MDKITKSFTTNGLARLDPIGSVISEHYNVVDIVCTNRNDFHIHRKRH